MNKKMLSQMLGKKKGELPGWSIVVMLILGLVGLFIIIYLSYKSGGKAFEWIDYLNEIFNL